jgi:hypothetical protein
MTAFWLMNTAMAPAMKKAGTRAEHHMLAGIPIQQRQSFQDGVVETRRAHRHEKDQQEHGDDAAQPFEFGRVVPCHGA